ncbi:MAG: NAD(P)/FAD-dependent oxidoreductase, partial [Gammaproteobacteria bacterium]|nr:NAD(P)/FAD-dependent oxidoreductase [Gammaproteobacteria bacterium]
MHHVVIGAGPSGVVAAETIRKLDPSAGVTLIGGEPEPPYSRMAIPYLLIDQIDESGTYLRRDESHFNSNYVEYKQAQVEHIRRGDNTLELSNGTKMSYDRLLIATGSTPVKPPIPGVDCEGVSHCWTLNDARKIIEKTQEGSRVVLMGAGFIG